MPTIIKVKGIDKEKFIKCAEHIICCTQKMINCVKGLEEEPTVEPLEEITNIESEITTQSTIPETTQASEPTEPKAAGNTENDTWVIFK